MGQYLEELEGEKEIEVTEVVGKDFNTESKSLCETDDNSSHESTFMNIRTSHVRETKEIIPISKRLTSFLYPFVFGIVVGIAIVIVAGTSLQHNNSICSAPENKESTQKPSSEPSQPKKQMAPNGTRTIIFDESGKVEELHKCPSKQSIIPNIQWNLQWALGMPS